MRVGHFGFLTGMSKFADIVVHRITNRKGRRTQLKLGLHSLRQRWHERGFICNRIVVDAVAPSVYTTPTETIGETGSIWKRCQKWSVFKTMRFYLSCKQRNRIDLNKATFLARNLNCSIQNGEFSTLYSARLYHNNFDSLVKTIPCKHFQTVSILTRFRTLETVSMWNRVRVNLFVVPCDPLPRKHHCIYSYFSYSSTLSIFLVWRKPSLGLQAYFVSNVWHVRWVIPQT